MISALNPKRNKSIKKSEVQLDVEKHEELMKKDLEKSITESIEETSKNRLINRYKESKKADIDSLEPGARYIYKTKGKNEKFAQYSVGTYRSNGKDVYGDHIYLFDDVIRESVRVEGKRKKYVIKNYMATDEVSKGFIKGIAHESSYAYRKPYLTLMQGLRVDNVYAPPPNERYLASNLHELSSYIDYMDTVNMNKLSKTNASKGGKKTRKNKTKKTKTRKNK
jgi:hypothetical protein